MRYAEREWSEQHIRELARQEIRKSGVVPGSEGSIEYQNMQLVFDNITYYQRTSPLYNKDQYQSFYGSSYDITMKVLKLFIAENENPAVFDRHSLHALYEITIPASAVAKIKEEGIDICAYNLLTRAVKPTIYIGGCTWNGKLEVLNPVAGIDSSAIKWIMIDETAQYVFKAYLEYSEPVERDFGYFNASGIVNDVYAQLENHDTFVTGTQSGLYETLKGAFGPKYGINGSDISLTSVSDQIGPTYGNFTGVLPANACSILRINSKGITDAKDIKILYPYPIDYTIMPTG